MANKISVIIDVAVDKASASLKNFRTDLAKAEGAAGKMKVGWGAASTAISANAGALAASAGAALVSFGVKSVQAFQDTALAARDFSNATGVAVEDASRLAEVAGDFGIEASAVEGAIMKMNKALGDGKPVFEQYGVEIAKTDSGLVDANATFINAITTIGAIQDPTKRAQAAQQAFGKSYGEVARFMEMSADELREALAGVSDQQAISDEEAKRAEEFALAMDNLQDSLQAVSMQVGGDLVPMLTSLAEALSFIQSIRPDEDSFLGKLTDTVLESVNPIARLQTVVEDVSGWFGIGGDEAEDFGEASEELAAAADAAGISLEDAGGRAQYYASRVAGAKLDTDRAKRAIDEMNGALDILQGNLDDRAAWRNLKESLDELQETIADNESTWMDLSAATDDAVSATAAYIMAADHIPTEKKTELITMLDQGALDMVLLIIDDLAKGVDVPVRLRQSTITNIQKRANGGPVRAGEPYLVGEEGPELVVPSQSGTVLTAGETRQALSPVSGSGMGSGSGTGAITVNIYPRALPTDRELIDLINNVRRRNGDVI